MPHIHDKIDFTAEVFVLYEDKVFLRKHDKYNIWLSVGGHIELDEDPNQAAVREVREETGLQVRLINTHDSLPYWSDSYSELISPVFLNRHRINETHEHVTHVFFGISESDKIIQQQSEQSNEYMWFSRDDLEHAHDVPEHVKRYALKALEYAPGV